MDYIYIVTKNSHVYSDGFKTYERAKSEFDKDVSYLQPCGFTIFHSGEGYAELVKHLERNTFYETLSIDKIKIMD